VGLDDRVAADAAHHEDRTPAGVGIQVHERTIVYGPGAGRARRIGVWIEVD